MSAPNVLGIGSCRVFRPLRHLHENGRITLLNHNSHQWFTHTASGAVQYADLITGKASLPPHLRPAVLETEMDVPEDLVFGFEQPDLVMVEVSTLKEHVLDRFTLNAHKVYGLAVAAEVPYRPVINGLTEALPDNHILKDMVVRYATAPEILVQLEHIRNVFGVPLITVDHLYTESSNGEPIPERTKLSDILRALEHSHGLAHYSTKPVIQSAGLDTALEDQNHYRKDFEPIVASAMFSRIEAVMRSENT